MKTSKYFLSKAMLIALVYLGLGSVPLLAELVENYDPSPQIYYIKDNFGPSECTSVVEISGFYPGKVTSVMFGKIPAVSFKQINEETISATVPPIKITSPKETVKVTVTHKNTTSNKEKTATAQFTYLKEANYLLCPR